MLSIISSLVISSMLLSPINNVQLYEQTKYSLNEIHKSISKYANEITVLMYHDFIDGESNKPTRLPIQNFEEQMKYLHENGYKTATIEELEQFIKGEIVLPKKTVVITFDDGYLSNYVYAYPILKKYNFKATMFAVTSTVNEVPEQYVPNKSTHISWIEMNKSDDIFTFGSHTHDLHKLSSEEESYLINKSYDDVVKDLRISREKLKTQYFAYPYGYYNKQTLEILKRMNFKMAFTVTNGKVSKNTDPYRIPRYGIDPSVTLEDFKKYIGE